MERVELRDESYVSLLSVHVPALDENQSHSHRRWCDNNQETLPRVSDERERTSTGSERTSTGHGRERSIGMAGVDHEIRTEHSAESTKSHERHPPCEDLSLRAHSL